MPYNTKNPRLTYIKSVTHGFLSIHVFRFTDFCQFTYSSNVFRNSTYFGLRIFANSHISATHLGIQQLVDGLAAFFGLWVVRRV